MSHLFKKSKKTLFLIKFIIFTPILLLFSKVCFLYTGYKIIYILFSFVSFYLILFSFRKKSLFYENFFGVLLFLGFWLKFSFIIAFDLGFGEGMDGFIFIFPKNFDDALLASICGFLGFIFYGHIRELYFSYPDKITLNFNNPIYEKYRILILSIFICLILSICFANTHFRIYQRGLIGENYHFLISGFVKTALLYFLSFCSAIILYFDLVKFKKIFLVVILIVFFEAFFSSVSMLSRGMIFNSSALLFALYKFTNKINLFLKLLTLLLITFYFSVYSVNYLRTNIHKFGNMDTVTNINLEKLENYKKEHLGSVDNIKTPQNIGDTFRSKIYANSILNLVIFRWVGIESILIVTKNKEILGFDMFKKSLNEKFKPNNYSFYETIFSLKGGEGATTLEGAKGVIKGNTLPGIIAYLFFTGSFTFLFFVMFILCGIASILEFLTFMLLGKNMLASSIIAMSIAYRYAHFGYLPKQSYLLFGSIIGVIIILFILKKLYKKLILSNK